jgi:hypothetical protein
VAELASFITQNDPTIKGFSDKNLWRMKQFYETYHDDEKLSPLLRELHPSIDNTFKDIYVLEFLVFNRLDTTKQVYKGNK